MKIEFRKVPQIEKELEFIYNSVKIEGTFCKISQSLVKIDAVLKGNTEIDCCRWENWRNWSWWRTSFIISDGIYKNDESEF